LNYKKFTLDNGLRVVFVPLPNLESATITVWVKTGSRNEEEKVNGVSHFLEHMVFKGSKKRPSTLEISQAVDAIGAEFNAATSKDWTNFYIKASVGNLETGMDVLSDMVLNPLLKKEEIEREKGVIIEEIAMYEDTPMIKIGDVFEELMFAGSSLGWDVAGTADSVKRMAKSDFERHRESYYYPDNMLITVSGGVDEKEVRGLAEKYFGELKAKSEERKGEPAFNKFSARQAKPQVKLHPKKKEQAHLILGFLGHGRGYEGRFAEATLSAILGGGMSSRLFIEVRERRGLAYAVKTSIDRYIDTGYLATYAGVDPKKIEEAVAVMLEQHYGISNFQFPISKEELKKAKEYLKGHFALALEDTKEVNDFTGLNELFLGKVETPEEIFDKVDSVTIENVVDAAKKLFRPERLNLAIIGPYKDGERFRKLIE